MSFDKFLKNIDVTIVAYKKLSLNSQILLVQAFHAESGVYDPLYIAHEQRKQINLEDTDLFLEMVQKYRLK